MNEAPSLQRIANEVNQLTKEERIRLIELIVESLKLAEPEPRSFRFGVFAGPNMSTEDDFKIAEWYGDDLDG
jgi:hypothetical protein